MAVLRIDGISFAADRINSNRHEINLWSQSESGGSQESLLLLQFYGPDKGKAFYDDVKQKMKEKLIIQLKE